MKRLVMLTIMGMLLSFGLSRAADEAKGDKVEFEVHKGYFEKNTSGLKGETSFLFITDEKVFDSTFGRAPTMDMKPNFLPQGAFEKKSVAAVIKRGKAVTDYEVEKVTNDSGTLYVQYKAKTRDAVGATYASPMIVSLPKGKYTSVVFIENGKTVDTLKVENK